ncbi:MAG: GHKL domain-containing protein [Bacteroidetes bacterium]|nr:GHKL domain-containing protein [Bacteroidota bacterium]
MEETKMMTWFAPAERADSSVVRKQHDHFMGNELLINALESIYMAVMILNGNRQLVFANKVFMDIVGISDLEQILGFRPGEALGCIYSDVMKGGCGTSEHCRECGAAMAILSSLDSDYDIQECGITLNKEQTSLDLRVMSSPLESMDETFAIFSISDIGDEKRREFLERIFLHDLKNTAGGLQGFSRLLKEVSEAELVKYKDVIQDLADKLLEEIESYSQLTEAENKLIEINPVEFGTRVLLDRIRNLYMNHEVSMGREIKVDHKAGDFVMISDETMMGRILGNMTKNALEAIPTGKTVTLSCSQEGDRIRFSVHNPGMMPRSSQLQIFQRSFSTKGSGRGLGTYSIKLMSEQYLTGKVGFTSSENEGTTFYGIYPGTLN